MLPVKAVPLVAALLLAVPTAVIVGPSLLAAPPHPDEPRNLPPVYLPNGMGAFPSEGEAGLYGCVQPAKLADVLAGLYAEGTEVCLETSYVTHNLTVRRITNDTTANFTIQAPTGESLVAQISDNWWAHGTPVPGMWVVVEGPVVKANGTWELDPVRRWVDLNHPGIPVDAWHVAAGLIPEGTPVWVNRTTILMVYRNNDGVDNVGDNHVETATVCPTAKLTTETTPAYHAIIAAPPIGATVRMYGGVRFDDYHGHFEIHPIRAWQVLPSTDALKDCPDRIGESGVPPPGVSECLLSLLPLNPPLECPELPPVPTHPQP